MRLLALLAALTLLATACLGGDEGAGGGDGEGAAGGTEGEGGGGGQTVSVLGALVDQDQKDLLASLQPWEEETGNTIEYEGSGDFETLINTRVQGGNPPDIALFPQTGLMRNVQELGGLQPIGDIIGEDYASSVGEAIVELGTIDDTLYGVLYRLNVKSLVWHPVPQFSDMGYQAPETWDEMLQLTEQIAQDGEVTAPWCIGIESSGATGWVITDWFEDLMLQTHGPEVYDQWVNHEIPFTAPEVQQVGEMFAELAFTEGWVLGGRQGIVTTPFGDAPDPMFEEPPACLLHRQAQFITSFFPEDIQEDVPGNAGFFPFPDVEGGFEGEPLLIAGDIATLLTDDPAAQSLIQFMATPKSGEAWAQAGGFISPHPDFDSSNYPNQIFVDIADLVQEADAIRFDGSDAMPGAVGAGSFWTEMTAWVNGDIDLETALQNIEESWPTEGGGGGATEGG